MVVDSSAVLAVIFDERDGAGYRAALAHARVRLMSVVSVLEAAMVVTGRYGSDGEDLLDETLHDGAVELVPVTSHHLALARQAFRRFGKGRHRAGLNFGDCFVYALAKATNEPLLAKGNDFKRTDLKLVV